jgi:head-tail adaptor
MEAGRLDRRITILRTFLVDDGYSSAPGAPAVFISRAAEFQPQSDAEKQRSDELQATQAAWFRVRYDSQTATIDARDTLEFEGRVWQITGVKPLPGRREGFEITAVARAEAP